MGSGKKAPKGRGKKKKAIKRNSEEAIHSGMEISDHKHCFNCGKAISVDRDICSDSCQEEWDKMLRKKKMLTYLPIIGGILLILFYILIMSQGG